MIGAAHVIGMGRLGKHWADRLESLNIRVYRWSTRASDGVKALVDWPQSHAAEAVFLAVPDGRIQEVAQQILPHLPPDCIMVHHAGAVRIDALPIEEHRRAVMWPPMTFMLETPPDWNTLPLGIESSEPKWLDLGRLIAPKAFALTAETRPMLHLGAVLAGNLTAAWLGVVESFLKQHGLPISTLGPLVLESVHHAMKGNALDTVSGPASRNDTTTLRQQIDTLQSVDAADDGIAILHRILTNCILQHHGYDTLPPFQAAPCKD